MEGVALKKHGIFFFAFLNFFSFIFVPGWPINMSCKNKNKTEKPKKQENTLKTK